MKPEEKSRSKKMIQANQIITTKDRPTGGLRVFVTGLLILWRRWSESRRLQEEEQKSLLYEPTADEMPSFFAFLR
jgi:hypothetical protein